MTSLRLVPDQPTVAAASNVVPLAPRRPAPQPAYDHPVPPRLRLVVPGERQGDAFRLDVFLARARVVMSGTDAGLDRPALRAIPPAS